MLALLAEIAIAALLLGVSAFVVTAALRKIDPFETLALQGVRPWTCDLCMSAWTATLPCALFGAGAGALAAPALAGVPWWHPGLVLALAYVPGAGVSLALLEWYRGHVPPLPPGLE